MHHFAYRNGILHAEDVSLEALAGRVGTPFYCYSAATLERHYRVFAGAFADTDALGAGMDIVSGGELRRALAAGVPGERIVFSGVAKTRAEMADALDHGILCFNV